MLVTAAMSITTILTKLSTCYFLEELKNKYRNAYRHFIRTKKTLELLFLKFLFSGPPRLGKTTACRRLMGEIVDLMSAGEADRVHASTGAVESGSNMIVKRVSRGTALVTKAEWCAAKSSTDEARMLFLLLEQSMETEDAPPNAISIPAMEKVATRTTGEVTAATPTTTLHVRSHSGGFLMKLRRKFMSAMRKYRTQSRFFRVTPEFSVIECECRVYMDAFPLPNTTAGPTADIPLIAELFKKASEQPEFLEEVQHHFRAFLRMEDTGGQPELMDMLPALTIGPGLYLVFFNLEWNLKKEFKVFYQHPSGKITTPEESKITLEEMLLSTLSSISCSSASANRLKDEEVNSSDVRDIFESSKSVAYLVGTHKDKVSEEHISQFDEDLQSIIRGTDFFEKGLVKFCSEGKLIVAMDNMKGGVEEVKAIREMLDIAMERHFKPLRIPAVWLLFNLCLTRTNKRTACMKKVLELSSQFNMSAEETRVALWFLHHHAGVMMYFPNVPLLQDLVILDTQVVYDSVTFLVLRTMSFDNVGQACSEKFRETGQFVLEDLVTATSRVSGGDFIPPEKLIALLEFLHIIAPIPRVQDSQSSTQEQEAVYLMPCVLHTASKEKLDAVCHDQSRPQCVSPLMVRYKCGFVPLGIFPALVASLISNKSFILVQRGMMKNKVQFRYQPLKTLVSFLCYPRFYAIAISQLSVSEHEVHKECAAIRWQVVSALEQVGSHVNYGYSLDYQFAFECPSHPGKEHLCVVDEQSEVTKLMECLECPDDRKPEKMGSVHTVWWSEVS